MCVRVAYFQARSKILHVRTFVHVTRCFLDVHVFVEIDDAQLHQALGPLRWEIVVPVRRSPSSGDLVRFADEKYRAAAQTDGHLKSSGSGSDGSRSMHTSPRARWTEGKMRGTTGGTNVSEVSLKYGREWRNLDAIPNSLFLSSRWNFHHFHFDDDFRFARHVA